MAQGNVFGTAIDQAFVMRIPEYVNRARLDRSVVAMQRKDQDGNYNAAVAHVREVKRQWGDGVSTLCVLYNGTGEPAASGSMGAVVYRGKNKEGEDTDWLVAWDTPWDRLRFANQAYAEINKAGHYDTIDWEALERKISEEAGSQNRVAWSGCVAQVQTGTETSPLWEGVLSLE
ncbi:23 kDa jasmonate-induced protein-like [Gossypium australe]|uniref:23 kDa jasmonate-induced protein-like n=1 Tax=Gossypium australe TaxID=47621 RepID=A0A5B6WEN2_9ROSI|nr:23 kDa jasmonate-induced protein-like [Gossypium australe]